MSGDWIKITTNISEKPEVWAMAAELSIDPDAVVGKLFRVWAWFDQHTESGVSRNCHAVSVTKMLLDRQVSVTGFCDAMIKAGWMVEDGDELSLPNFDRHNGETAKKRAQASKRKEKQRSSRKCHARSVTETGQEREKSVTREEKRREEKKEEKDLSPGATTVPDGSGKKPVGDSPDPEPLEGSEPAIFTEAWPEERLDDWIDRWNSLPPLVTKVKNRRTAAILAVWRRVQREPDLRMCFDDLDLLFQRIRDQPWLLSQGWFNFTWLFSQKNHQFNARKILEGRYAQVDSRASPVRQHDPNCETKHEL